MSYFKTKHVQEPFVPYIQRGGGMWANISSKRQHGGNFFGDIGIKAIESLGPEIGTALGKLNYEGVLPAVAKTAFPEISALSDFATRSVTPWLARLSKTASSGATKKSKAKATNDIIDHAKQAVQEGLSTAANKISQGGDVGSIVKTTADETKKKISNTIVQQVSNLKRKNDSKNDDQPLTKKAAAKKTYKTNPPMTNKQVKKAEKSRTQSKKLKTIESNPVI